MTDAKHPQLRRWGIFNLVGLVGFGLQLGLLIVLKQLLGMGYLVATAVAVEVTLLHNFIWHEHVTWADAISPFRHGVAGRLVRFHLANGLISIAGNLAFTGLFVRSLRWPYLLANAASVLICSLLNFAVGDLFVFGKVQEPIVNCRQVPKARLLASSKRIGCST